MNTPAASMTEIVMSVIDPMVEWRYRKALCREAYQRGYQAGYHDGYEQAARDLERNWQVIAARVKRDALAPTYAELQERRAS